ncbi:MAG TPA: sigma-70 family RNA polymerase sigma factor [Chitinophagaceae bacterium]|nr:sigma-70 family RNA polymerase sigma factor [Chitinophagaceae bacterium]
MPSAEDQIAGILQGCQHGVRESQQKMYDFFFGYAMGICMRYTRNREDATEVLNDGFVKIFRNVGKFRVDDRSRQVLPPLQAWIKKIMVYTAIDHFRAQQKFPHLEDILGHQAALENRIAGPLETLAYEDLISLVQQLSPAYRAVFNLYVIEGFDHEEIAQKLGISSGTSKSNLARARESLRKKLKRIDERTFVRYDQ